MTRSVEWAREYARKHERKRAPAMITAAQAELAKRRRLETMQARYGAGAISGLTPQIKIRRPVIHRRRRVHDAVYHAGPALTRWHRFKLGVWGLRS